MCEELRLERYDNSPWGFRLTGGLDFGTPLSIIKVTGGSIAEHCGVHAGDLVKTINGKPTTHFTHLDAQKCIASSGNYLTLTVMRGSVITPPVTPLRGRTPVNIAPNDRAEEFNNYSPSPTILKSQIENEIMNYYNNASDVTDGFKSPATVRQKTCQKATLRQKNGHKVTDNQYSVNDEGQLLLGDRALTDFEIAELLTSNEEVLDEGVLGINFKKFLPKVDFIRNSEVFKLLQNENTKKEISEQAQLLREPGKRFSTFLMKPKAPPEGPKGPTFVKFKPPRYLPKPPEKKWELPKLKPWERPKKEDPAHSVLWLFMDEKVEEIIDERWGTDEEERINESRNSYIEYEHSELSSVRGHEDDSCSVTSRDQLDSRLSKPDESLLKEEQITVEEKEYLKEQEERREQEKKEQRKRKFKIEAQIESIEYNVPEEAHEVAATKKEEYLTGSSGEIQSEECRAARRVEEQHMVINNKLVAQLAEITSQIEALQNEAPSDLMTQLLEVKEQLSKIVQIKTSSQETNERKEEQERRLHQRTLEQERTASESIEQLERRTLESSVEHSGKGSQNISVSPGSAIHHFVESQEESAVTKKTQESVSSHQETEVHQTSSATREVQKSVTETTETTEIIQHTSEKHLEVSTYQVEELQEAEYQLCIAPQPASKQKKKPTSHPITPQTRPIVLPGGRMWRKPKDAEHEDFYQGVLVAQAEVLVGTNDGVNFTKYVPPKVDMSTSEVYRLIHESEEKPKNKPQEPVPEVEYCQPISKRHFYAATLREPPPIGVVELSDLDCS